jgi:excisionase family DNA binding protein
MNRSIESQINQVPATVDQSALQPVLTPQEAAMALKVSRWMIYELIRKRELTSFTLGRKRLVPTQAVHALVANRLDAEAV